MSYHNTTVDLSGKVPRNIEFEPLDDVEENITDEQPPLPSMNDFDLEADTITRPKIKQKKIKSTTRKSRNDDENIDRNSMTSYKKHKRHSKHDVIFEDDIDTGGFDLPGVESGSGSGNEYEGNDEYEYEDKEDEGDDEYEDETSSMYSEESLTPEEIDHRKDEGIAKLRKYSIKGYESDKIYTRAHTLTEIEDAVERVEDQINLDKSIKWYRKITMFSANLVEWVEKKFNFFGLHLNGWAENLYENLDEFDEIFEELHEKYKGVVKVPPEIKLLTMFFGSAYIYHVSQSSNQDKIQEKIFLKNPDLKRAYQQTAAQVMSDDMNGTTNTTSGGGFGVASLLGGILGGGGGGGGGILNSIFGGKNTGNTSTQQAPQQQSRPLQQRMTSNNEQNMSRDGIEDEMSGPEDEDNMLDNLIDDDEEQDLTDIESLSEL